MDNDALRRGRPTTHVVYGDGMAILAGDGLLTEAFACSPRRRRRASPAGAPQALGRRGGCGPSQSLAAAAGAAGMVGGQAIDLAAAGRVPGTRAALDARRARRHARAQDRRADSRGRRRGRHHGRRATTRTRRGDRRLRARARPRLSDRRRHPRRRGSTTRSARPPARTPPPASRPIRRSTASTDRAGWPPSASSARTSGARPRAASAAGSPRSRDWSLARTQLRP